MGPGSYKGDAYIEGTSHNLWYASMLIGRSIVGIRSGDIVRLARLLKNNSEIAEIYGIARNEMTPVMLHAAAFDESITRIALLETYVSYQSIAMNRFYDSKFVYSIVPGALTAYDLPDLAACLAPRKLLIAGVTDGNGKSLDPEILGKDLDFIKISYQIKNANGQLNIVCMKPYEKFDSYFMEWIK